MEAGTEANARRGARLRALALGGEEDFLDRRAHRLAHRSGFGGVAGRVDKPGIDEALAAQAATVAAATVQPIGRRIVAGPAHPRVHSKPRRFSRAIGLADRKSVV